MSNACTPILVGVASPVSKILLPSRATKFPFRTMDNFPFGQFPFGHFPFGHFPFGQFPFRSMVAKKLNYLELAQKFYASRG